MKLAAKLIVTKEKQVDETILEQKLEHLNFSQKDKFGNWCANFLLLLMANKVVVLITLIK